MTNASIAINQGDSVLITETITGVSSLSGFTAKLYIKDLAGVAIGTITGVIVGLVVTYTILNDVSKLYKIGTYKFETKLFSAGDIVYTPNKGTFIVNESLNSDPT